MTFEQNWNNLISRKDASNAGTLNKTIKDQYPLTPNFTKWASAEYDAICLKLQSPEPLGTIEKSFSQQDWVNFLLSASNKFLRKEKLFPVSEELAQFANNLSSIDKVIGDIKNALFTERCIICDDDLNRHKYHCDTCEATVTQSVHPDIEENIQKDLKKTMKRAEKSFFEYHNTVQTILAQKERSVSLYSFLNSKNTKTLIKLEAQVIEDMLTEISEAQKTPLQKEMEKIEAKIAEWNPRVNPRRNNEEVDEFGNPVNPEYIQEPEIIGEIAGAGHVSDVPELNEHFVGKDEYDEDVYRDFDEDGFYLPQGNPNNSSDTREDADMSDYTQGRANDWQSADFVEDFHNDYYYHESSTTETPNFDTDGNITEWTEVNHCNAADEVGEPTIYEKEDTFLQDALNWIQREQYMEKAEESDQPIVMWEIEQAFPVSEWFLEYLSEIGMDYETFQERLGQELENLKGEPNGDSLKDIAWV